ncbi:MAG: PorT family protein [Tannerella sp.]|jgi:hypothetical protein|nr:PorT family protein [Tannerella sp.]
MQTTKKIFLLLLTFTSITVNGQNHFWGVKSGVNYTNITAKNAFGDEDFRTGLIVGITYDYFFRKHFSIGADVVYNQRGSMPNIIYDDNSGSPTGQKGIFKLNYDYVTVPLKVGYNYGTTFYRFANIGLTPSILVDAKTFIPSIVPAETVLPAEIHNVKNRVNQFDIGGFVEIGGGYKFQNRLWGFLSFSYQHSLTTFTNLDYFANIQARHYGISVNLGLKYALSGE